MRFFSLPEVGRVMMDRRLLKYLSFNGSLRKNEHFFYSFPNFSITLFLATF